MNPHSIHFDWCEKFKILIFGGHFVLVSACQDVKILLLYQQNVANIGQNDLS